MNASRPDKPLTPKQRIALLALANGERPYLVGLRSGVSVATIYRWRRNPLFQQALDAALEDFHGNFPKEEAAARIFAFQALTNNARCGQPADQIRAASTLLRYLDRPKTVQKNEKPKPTPTPSTT